MSKEDEFRHKWALAFSVTFVSPYESIVRVVPYKLPRLAKLHIRGFRDNKIKVLHEKEKAAK